MLHAFQPLPFAMAMLTSSLARAILAFIQKNKLLSLVRNGCGLRQDRVEVRDGLLPARFRERPSRSSVAKSLEPRYHTETELLECHKNNDVIRNVFISSRT